MSEVLLSEMLGRRVFDVDGQKLGRLEEMRAEIQLLPDGVDYVIVEYHVGTYGALEAMGGGKFARQLMHLLDPVLKCRRFRIPWEWMDLSDPTRPVVTRRASEVPTIDD